MTQPLNHDSRARSRAWFLMTARIILGAVFIYMGGSKALDPVGFLKLTRQYDLVHVPILLNLIAVIIPWLEVFCGLLLLSGLAIRGSAMLLSTMLVAFTAIVIRRALAIHAATLIPFCAIKFDCGCGNGPVFICHKVAENALLLLLALSLLFWQNHRATKA
jgi:putative oxidoreductase